MDLDAMAARLYPSSAPTVAASPSVPQADTGPNLYAEPKPLPAVDVPEGVKALREADDTIENRLYRAETTPHHDLVAAVNAIEPDPEAARAQAAEWSRVARDTGADPSDVAIAVAAIRRLSTRPPSDEEEAASAAQASADFDRQHGSEAPRVRSAIRMLLDRDQRLATQLIDSGAIFDSQIFLALGRLALGQAARGRLKQG